MGYNPSYKWINSTYPIYNWGYNPLTKWDEPPSRPHVPRGKPQPSPTSWSPKGARTRGDIDERGLLQPGDRVPGDALRDLLLGEDCLGETGEISQAGCGESLPPTSFSVQRPAPIGPRFSEFHRVSLKIGATANASRWDSPHHVMGHCHWTPTPPPW